MSSAGTFVNDASYTKEPRRLRKIRILDQKIEKFCAHAITRMTLMLVEVYKKIVMMSRVKAMAIAMVKAMTSDGDDDGQQ